MLSNFYLNFTNSWMNSIYDKSINIDKTNMIQHFPSRGHIHLLKPYLFGLKHLGYRRNFLGIQSVPRLKVDFILIYNTRWLNTHPQVILKIGSRKVSILHLYLWLWQILHGEIISNLLCPLLYKIYSPTWITIVVIHGGVHIKM